MQGWGAFCSAFSFFLSFFSLISVKQLVGNGGALKGPNLGVRRGWVQGAEGATQPATPAATSRTGR